MGGDGIACHTLKGGKTSVLKRGKTYVYDTMNLLYSMCFTSSIADLLNQSPPVPTHDIVGFAFYLNFWHSLLTLDPPFYSILCTSTSFVSPHVYQHICNLLPQSIKLCK